MTDATEPGTAGPGTAAPDPAKSDTVELRVRPGPRPRWRGRRGAVYAVVAVLLAVIGYVVYVVGAAGPSAPEVVVSYLHALGRGDADAALALGDAPEDRTLLTDDVLRQQQKLAPIGHVRVLGTRVGDGGAVVRVHYRVGTRTVTDDFEVLRRGDGWALNHVAVDVEFSSLASLPRPTVFGISIPNEGDVYVFPGEVRFGSAAGNFDLTPATAVFTDPDVPAMVGTSAVLSTSGRRTVAALVSAAMHRCAQSRSLHPKGCPQHTARPTVRGLIAKSLRWHAPLRYGDLDITVDSHTPGLVHVDGRLTWHLTFSVRTAHAKHAVRHDRTVRSSLDASVDFRASSPTLRLG